MSDANANCDDIMIEICSWVVDKCEEIHGEPQIVTPQTDLLANGILDSLAFTQLIAVIEESTGGTIDLLEIDPESFTSVKGLCEYALNQSGTKE